MTVQDTAWAWEQVIPAREKLLLLAMSEVLGDAANWCEWNDARTEKAVILSSMSKDEVSMALMGLVTLERIEVRTASNGKRQLRFNYAKEEAAFVPRRYDPGYVYVLRAGDHYKIGKSKHPNKRIEQIQTASPFRVQQLARIEVQDMGTLERHLHARFADRRANGEWFHFEQEEIDLIMDELRSADEINTVWRAPR